MSLPLSAVKGIGPARAARLAEAGLTEISDLWRFLPLRHLDYASCRPIGSLAPGEAATVCGQVRRAEVRRAGRTGLFLLRTIVADATGEIGLVWFQAVRGSGRRAPGSVPPRHTPGEPLMAAGVVRAGYGSGLEMVNPECEPGTTSDLHTGRLVPIYPRLAGFGPRLVRRLVRAALADPRNAPPPVVPARPAAERDGPVDSVWAWRQIHFPESPAALEAARRRLALEELVAHTLALQAAARARQAAAGSRSCRPAGKLCRAFLAGLPYELTGAQKRVVHELDEEMASGPPIARLLQGDVGSGKTLIAAYMAVKAVENGYQAALAAPTQVLAEQHRLRLSTLFAPFGIPTLAVRGDLPAAQREKARRRLSAGEPLVAIGTHALLSEASHFARLGAAVVDEEHRFGVTERCRLLGQGTHLLVMTATPIPRSLALVLYGDLTLSVLDEKPGRGRPGVDTRLIDPARRAEVYAFVRREVERGHRAYIVYPRIDPAAENETPETAAAAAWSAQILAEGPLSGLSVGLLHGRLKEKEKERAMAAFAAGEIQVLVATSVVEVGLDVPEATVMVIEEAERFGLAQLHQLRGRVGRGEAQGYCLLLARPGSPQAQERLQLLRRTTDGFELAEADWARRGPGEVLGRRQTGPDGLRFVDWARDQDLLVQARALAAGAACG